MKRVLVVDDEPSVTDGLVALFEIQSIEATGAYDRESAEEMIAAEFFPLIIADLRLRTEEDGLMLLESIRRISPASRIATLTGYATAETEALVRSLGSSVVLEKPVSLDEVVGILSAVLDEIESASAEAADPIVLETLYAKMKKVLFSIPQRRYGMTSDEADDIVQQAWFLYLERQSGVQNAATWLAGTVANLCKQQIQRKTRARRHSADEEALYELTTESTDETMLMVGQALGRVDDRSRELCWLIAVEGWSYEEVSARLGIAIGSVGPLYIRAKARMRKAMEN